MNIARAIKLRECRRYRGIYLLTADAPGASYVGQTRRTFSGRWSDHITLLQSGVHHNDIMQGAFRRVGIAGVHACILKVAPPLGDADLVRWLFAWEQYWIERIGWANESRGRG